MTAVMTGGTSVSAVFRSTISALSKYIPPSTRLVFSIAIRKMISPRSVVPSLSVSTVVTQPAFCGSVLKGRYSPLTDTLEVLEDTFP